MISQQTIIKMNKKINDQRFFLLQIKYFFIKTVKNVSKMLILGFLWQKYLAWLQVWCYHLRIFWEPNGDVGIEGNSDSDVKGEWSEIVWACVEEGRWASFEKSVGSLKWRAKGSEDNQRRHGRCKWRRRARVLLVWTRRMPWIKQDMHLRRKPEVTWKQGLRVLHLVSNHGWCCVRKWRIK